MKAVMPNLSRLASKCLDLCMKIMTCWQRREQISLTELVTSLFVTRDCRSIKSWAHRWPNSTMCIVTRDATMHHTVAVPEEAVADEV